MRLMGVMIGQALSSPATPCKAPAKNPLVWCPCNAPLNTTRLVFCFPASPFIYAFIAPYVILDTDYENFACIYSCTGNNFGYYSDFAFIFSRSPSLSDRYYRRCESAFMNIGVDPSRFTKTTQGSSCPYNSYRSW
ncbi:crustacyanin-A1 subunit-like [Penaeus japonicus]|uniref:crustacyanin-A1 subunit-like n=1 Tax=Penaeus japonicus TaxID=27405 RepID=UPI001C70C89E|nr:crustacyanin-A1 subunit-like [Penaeus japonicus]